eukprot:1145769-Pelagomonas_calceolata.AAC.5
MDAMHTTDAMLLRDCSEGAHNASYAQYKQPFQDGSAATGMQNPGIHQNTSCESSTINSCFQRWQFCHGHAKFRQQKTSLRILYKMQQSHAPSEPRACRCCHRDANTRNVLKCIT